MQIKAWDKEWAACGRRYHKDKDEYIVQDMQGKRCLTNAIQATRKLSKQREIVMGMNTCTVLTQCLGPRPHFDKLSLWGIMNPGLPFHGDQPKTQQKGATFVLSRAQFPRVKLWSWPLATLHHFALHSWLINRDPEYIVYEAIPL